MKNKFLAILSALFIFPHTFAKTYNVAALYWSMEIRGQVAMRFGLEEMAKNINKKGPDQIKLLHYVAGDGVDGIRNQIKQMKEAVDKKVDLIILQPTDSAALSSSVLYANKKKIPVIAYDQYVVEGKIEGYVTSNNFQAGYLNGEYIASQYKSSYPIRIILVDYPKVSSTIERVNGFFQALKDNKQSYKVIANYQAVEPLAGKLVGKKIIRHFPRKGSVDVIFTVNDGGGLAVVKVIQEAGRHEIKVATIDGDPLSIKNITQSKNTVINSAQFCAEIGRQSMRLGYEFLQGKKIPRKLLVPTFPVTKESISFYPGWKGSVPKSYQKVWLNNKLWKNDFVEVF